ncbi:DUF2905 domain-containing protein [Chloroflexota bacterium]
MISLTRILIVSGLMLIIAGGLIYLATRSGISLSRLPGNLILEGKNHTCVFALGASILLSIILTFGLNIIIRLWNK